uniref:(California timema) hypothetical protein n=1 Tax=Timema californicum TaxID=61474 RepID=A0A7R9JGR2_TIMCA|nr:unnamed protein product [Timema californicum]
MEHSKDLWELAEESSTNLFRLLHLQQKTMAGPSSRLNDSTILDYLDSIDSESDFVPESDSGITSDDSNPDLTTSWRVFSKTEGWYGNQRIFAIPDVLVHWAIRLPSCRNFDRGYWGCFTVLMGFRAGTATKGYSQNLVC